MPIDISKFSNAILDGIEEDTANWKPASEFPPPPDPGAHDVFIKQIRDSREKMTEKGPRLVVSFDAQIVGGKSNGRQINFQWASNIEFMTQDRGRTSTLLDMVKSAKVKGEIRTNQDFVTVLNKMEGNESFVFKIQNDWRGSCKTCYNQKIMELTGEPTPELAAMHVNPDQKKEANNFAVKFKTFRQFPVAGKDPNKRQAVVACADCGDEIRAQAQIVRYLL